MKTIFSTLCSFLMALPLIAVEPSWAKEITSAKPGSHPPLRPTKLLYQLSWKGQVQAGHVIFTFGAKGSNDKILKTTCVGGIEGVAAKLFPYSFDMQGQVNKNDLSPLLMHCSETDKEETQVTTVRYFPGMVNVKEVSRPHNTGVDATMNRTFAFAPVFDAFTSMLHIRSQTLKQGDEITIVIHPFASPYLAKIQVLGREKMNGNDAIKLDIGLTKINKDLTLKPYTKMKKATLWISDDADRIPLELRVAAYIGDVRMTLEKKESL